MPATDLFTDYYCDYLAGTYDCVDRFVLNATFRLGQSPGGFRTWWRQLKGSDRDLDDNHLIRMAGRFSRRLRAAAKHNNIPVVDCPPKTRKHELAKRYLPVDPILIGPLVA